MENHTSLQTHRVYPQPIQHGVRDGGRVGLDIVFSCSQISLRRWRLDGEDQLLLESRQLPTIGEWTRIELSHEEEDGKYFLSFAVEGGELEKKEATDPEFGEMTDVTIDIEEHRIQPGFIRRLLVLQKEQVKIHLSWCIILCFFS